MRILIKFTLVWFVLVLVATICHAQSSGKYIKIKAKGISFEVPKMWQRGSRTEAEEIRKQMLSGLNDFAKKFNTDIAKFSIPHIFIFFTSQEDCFIMISQIQLPPEMQSTDWLNMLYENNKEKIRLGINQGLVKEVFENRKTKINSIPVLVSDMEMVRGKLNRLTSYIFHSTQLLSTEIQISIFCDPEGYLKHKSDINHLVNTVKIGATQSVNGRILK